MNVSALWPELELIHPAKPCNHGKWRRGKDKEETFNDCKAEVLFLVTVKTAAYTEAICIPSAIPSQKTEVFTFILCLTLNQGLFLSALDCWLLNKVKSRAVGWQERGWGAAGWWFQVTNDTQVTSKGSPWHPRGHWSGTKSCGDTRGWWQDGTEHSDLCAVTFWRQAEGDKAPSTKSQLSSQEPLGLSVQMAPGAIWDTPTEPARSVINTFLANEGFLNATSHSCHQEFIIFF